MHGDSTGASESFMMHAPDEEQLQANRPPGSCMYEIMLASLSGQVREQQMSFLQR
jgi:hypothetical protein